MYHSPNRGESFLTSVKIPSRSEDFLADVRVEHVKLQGVTAAFGEKVERIIERQRKEFVDAYDIHMHDIQKKLITLRNKVISIDKNFREEKLRRIQAEEEKYRSEALRLDQVVLSEGQKLKRSARAMKAMQSEVDWLLNKFRQEKRKTKRINSAAHLESSGSNASLSLSSQASGPMRLRLTDCVAKPIHYEPFGMQFPPGEWPNPVSFLGRTEPKRSRIVASKSLPILAHPITHSSSRAAKQALRHLVSERSVQSEVLSFLHTCEALARKTRALLDNPDRDYRGEMVQKLEIITQLEESTQTESTRIEIMKDLASYPELFGVISDMIVDGRIRYETSFAASLSCDSTSTMIIPNSSSIRSKSRTLHSRTDHTLESQLGQLGLVKSASVDSSTFDSDIVEYLNSQQNA